MKILFWILGAAAGLYLLFGFLPSLIAFLYTYAGREGEDLDRVKKDFSSSQYGPYLPKIYEGLNWYRSLPLQDVSVRSREGFRLKGGYLSAGSEKTAILFHGYHTTVGNNYGILGKDLYDQGFNILFVHQRAFFGSEGRVCSYGQREQYDVLSWIEYADQELKAEKILLVGVSMGGATVCYASDKIENPKVRAIIDDCGFTSIRELQTLEGVRRKVPIKIMMPHAAFFAKLFYRIDVDKTPEQSLPHAKVPILFIHGTADESVPLSWGQRMYDACGSEKQKMLVEGAGHAVAYIASGDQGKRRVQAFLRKYFDN